MLHSSTAEQEAVNFKVPGSNPGGAANIITQRLLIGDIVQRPSTSVFQTDDGSSNLPIPS